MGTEYVVTGRPEHTEAIAETYSWQSWKDRCQAAANWSPLALHRRLQSVAERG